MRHLPLLLVLGASGCESGITIEVRAPAGTADVALFLATSACDDCTPITPPEVDVALSGSIYLRDGASMSAPVDGTGSAWFRFQPSESESNFAAVLAIGTAPELSEPVVRAGTAVALVTNLDVTGPREVVIDLAKTTDDSSGPRAGIWSSPDTGDLCAGYLPAGASPTRATLVVPSSNPDCDELVGVDDCDGFTHSSNVSVPPLVEATCLGREVVPTLASGSVCMLQGATGCSDADLCEPTLFCAPDRVCGDTCPPGSSVFQCIAAASETAAINCSVPVLPNIGLDVTEVCSRELVFPLPIPRCTSIELALVETDAPPDFKSKVEYDDAAGRKLIIEAQLSGPGVSGCTIVVAIQGTVALSSPQIPVPLVAKIEVPDGPVHGAVIPLDFTAVNQVADQCDQVEAPMLCELQARLDSAATCLGQP